MKTRNGVYYDLTKSTYKFKIPDTRLTFVFSSDLHLVKFEEQYLKNRIDHNTKNKARYRIETDMKTLPDLMLYRKIEMRGFLVIIEGGQTVCQENALLIGEKVTPKS
jgi:hypothetical protein